MFDHQLFTVHCPLSTVYCSQHHHHWLKQRSRDAFRDAHQVFLIDEDFDHGGIREFGEIGLRAVAEAAENMIVRSHRGHELGSIGVVIRPDSPAPSATAMRAAIQDRFRATL